MSLMNALRGISGEYEINRILGAAGVLTYVVTAPSFVGWSMYQGHPFDLVAFCSAYPLGLGAAIGAVAGAVAVKDTYVASAKVTQDTGSAPGLAMHSGVQPVKVVNNPSDPVPVEQGA